MTTANYGLDEMLRRFDPNGENWYSLQPTELRPYRSTIFAPTIVESVLYGVAGGLSGKARIGVVIGGWLVGSAANIVENRLRR